MDWLTDPQAWLALLTLTALEIVLGIDNIIFISILTGKLPEHQRPKAQKLGLSLAMITRLLLLFSLTWIMKLTAPFFHVFGHGVSGRDLILLIGGLFLLAKSTMEIHDKLEGEEHHADENKATVSFNSVLIQIMFLDIVFSLDSVITAVGMARQLGVMVTAVVISVGIMLFFAGSVSRFVDRHPTVKVLALSFLLMIGVALIADGLSFHIPKGYIYFAMAFSVFVEMINIRVRKSVEPPIKLRQHLVGETGDLD
jgi:predicted tellurium resistance membrane protein TerC